jgi:hypothetical protein
VELLYAQKLAFLPLKMWLRSFPKTREKRVVREKLSAPRNSTFHTLIVWSQQARPLNEISYRDILEHNENFEEERNFHGQEMRFTKIETNEIVRALIAENCRKYVFLSTTFHG